MGNREYNTPGPGTLGGGNTEHALTGFSSNEHWAEPSADSHNPMIMGPKDGFHDPVQAGPDRKTLWQDQNEPDAPDATTTWDVAYKEPGGIASSPITRPLSSYFGSGRSVGDSGTERGNSPWFKRS